MRYDAVDRAMELALVRGVRSGEEAAFDAIYLGYNCRLYGFLVRLTRRRDVAEELLEETWLRFVRHADRLQPDTQLGPWLFTVARNLHVSECRNRIRESALGDGLSLWPSAPPATPFDVAAETEFGQRLEAAIADLPEPLREAILLVGIEEMAPAQAAVVCGITPDAMRQRLHRARGQLSARLGYAIGRSKLQAGA
jgi:RNA polymerase sigma-70 factor (ECF subfamily)